MSLGGGCVGDGKLWSEFWGGGVGDLGFRVWWMRRKGERKNGHERMRIVFMAVENLEGDNVGTQPGVFVCQDWGRF